MTKPVCSLAVLAALAVVPLAAHHSAAAEYDASKLLVLNGTVAQFDWTNPHVHMHLTVRGIDWSLEMASPNGMRRQGWFPKTLNPGDRVTVEAYQAKDRANGGKIHRVKIPGGRWLFVDSTGPQD